MRKIVLIAGMLAVGLALPAWAQDDLLAEADFNDGRLPDFMSTTEGWSVVKVQRDVVLHGETGDDAVEFADISAGAEWGDYAVEARVSLAGGTFSMNARVPNTDNFCGGYGVAIIAESNTLDLFSLDDECNFNDLHVEEYEFPLDEWVVLRLEVVGNAIMFYIDGEEVLSATDNTYSTGFPTFTLFANSGVDIDELSVIALDATPASPGGVVENYNGDPQDVIEELFTLDVIPTRGRLLFEEDYAWFEGEGNWFTPLARRSPKTDVIMAGELTFRVGAPGEFERCNLSLRIETNNQGQATTYIDVAIVDGGDVLALDYSKPGEDATTFEYATLGLDLDDPHHLLIVALEDTLTVYVDGERVFDQLEIVERAGTFGIALVSTAQESRCEGRNLWVYQLDD